MNEARRRPRRVAGGGSWLAGLGLLATLGCETPAPAPSPSPSPSPVTAREEKPAVAPPRVVPSEEPAEPSSPPPGWVDLQQAVPGVRLQIGYATPDNFTGQPLPGYARPGAWLREEPARALEAVQAELATQGQGLLVFDAYRPVRASDAMVQWARAAGRTDVIRDGYVASRSNHNRGIAVDLTLIDAEGVPLPMGTAWDTFSPDSRYANAKGIAREHRRRLRQVMRRHGFVPYDAEWWHFTHRVDGDATPPPLDVPYR